MPYARDEAGNLWETDAAGNAVRHVQENAAPQMPAKPSYPYEGPKAAADVANVQTNVTGQQIKNTTDAATQQATIESARADAAKKAADAQVAQWQVAHNGLTPEQWGAANGGLEQINALEKRLGELRQQYNDNFKGGGVGALAEYLPSILRPANGVFDDTAGTMLADMAKAKGLTSQQFNTPAEQRMFFQPMIPNSWERDAQTENKLRMMQDMIDTGRGNFSKQMGIPAQQAAQQGNTPPPAFGNGTPPPQGGLPIAGSGAPGGGLTNAPTYATPQDMSAKDALEKAYQSGADIDTILNVAKQAGYPIGPSDLPGLQKLIEYRDKTGGFGTINPPETGRRNEVQQNLGAMMMNPVGTGIANAADATTMGGLSALAPDAMGGISNLNPKSAMLGQILGAIAGTGGLAKLGAKAVEKVAPSMADRLLSGGGMKQFGRTLATDTAYGAGYGHNANGDAVTGALGGVVGSAGGQALGKALGRALGGLKMGPDQAYLQSRGIPMTAGQMIGGPAKGIEDAMTSVPFAGDQVLARRLEGVQAFDRTAMNDGLAPIGGQVSDIGLPGNNQMFDQVSGPGGAYDQAVRGVNIPLDSQWTPDLQSVAQASRMLPPDYQAKFGQVMDNRVQPINNAGAMTGESYQQSMRGLKGSRSSAAAAAPGFEQEYRDAVTGAMDTVRGQMERGGGQRVVTGLQNADQSYRAAKTIAKAIKAAKSGSRSGEAQTFMPSQLNDADWAAMDKYGGGRQFGQLIDAAQNVLPSSLPDSGTAKRIAIQAGVGSGLLGLGAGGGAALGGTDGAQTGGLSTAAIIALLAAGGTKAGQKAITKGLFGRPAALKDMGAFIGKQSGLLGAAGVPVALGYGN